MERAGRWEFERDGVGRLTYRFSKGSTGVGWVIGGVIAAVLSYGAYTSAVKQEWGWAIGMGGFGIGAVCVLIKNQGLHSVRCVLDKRADQFRADNVVKCALSEIRQVACEWHKPRSRSGEISSRGSYQIYLLLHSGVRIHT